MVAPEKGWAMGRFKLLVVTGALALLLLRRRPRAAVRQSEGLPAGRMAVLCAALYPSITNALAQKAAQARPSRVDRNHSRFCLFEARRNPGSGSRRSSVRADRPRSVPSRPTRGFRGLDEQTAPGSRVGAGVGARVQVSQHGHQDQERRLVRHLVTSAGDSHQGRSLAGTTSAPAH